MQSAGNFVDTFSMETSVLSFTAACSRMQLLFFSLRILLRVFDVSFCYWHCLFPLNLIFSLFPYLCFKFYFVSSSALLRNPSDFCFLKMCWQRSSSRISFPISFNVIIARYSQRGKIKCMWSTSHFNWWERAWEICFFLIVPVLSIH